MCNEENAPLTGEEAIEGLSKYAVVSGFMGGYVAEQSKVSFLKDVSFGPTGA